MKSAGNLFILSFLFLSFHFFSTPSYAQGINPSHLFNTGLNMGFLSDHSKNGTAREQYGIWAANASTEWIASWNPGFVQPIAPDIEMPSVAHNEYVNTIMSMPTCFDPYFQARLSIYRSGFHLGQALAETGTSCSQCLQQEMQKAAVGLRTLSSLTGVSFYAEMSESLNDLAAGLKTSYSDDLGKQQNESMFEPVNAIIKKIQSTLPSDLIYCQKQEAEVSTQSKNEKPKDGDRKKRAFILKAGINSGYLKGDQGTKTKKGSGFHIGFDMYRGNPVYFAIGVKFFRNSTGGELMIPAPGQIVDTDDRYIQGFILGAGLGFYIFQTGDLKITATCKLNYIISHAINGNTLSIGYAEVTDGAFQLEAGATVTYKMLVFEVSYEPGLTEALLFNQEKMKYRLVNLSVGLRF